MERSIGNVITDNLDFLARAAIVERFGEPSRESSEGQTELGNPATVTQPVHQSQTPGGQPLNILPGVNSNTLLLFAGGGVVLILMGVLLARII